VKAEIPLHQAHRLLAPRPVCLLTVRYKGRDNVMTVAWVVPISLEPPMVLMAIHPSRYSHDMLRRSEECVLNIPGRALLDRVVGVGSVSGEDVDKFGTYRLEAERGRRVEAPWVVDCLAHIECTVTTMLSPGDHSIFMAQVVGAWAEEEAFRDTWRTDVDEELKPMYHLGGRAFCLMGEILEWNVAEE